MQQPVVYPVRVRDATRARRTALFCDANDTCGALNRGDNANVLLPGLTIKRIHTDQILAKLTRLEKNYMAISEIEDRPMGR